MSNMLVERARSYVDSLKKPDFLIDRCTRYWESEPRDAVYTVALDYAAAGTRVREKATAVTALLVSWNARYYTAERYEFKKRIGDDVERILSSSQGIFDEWAKANPRLQAVNLEKLESDILHAFSAFRNSRSIGLVGAAKSLHLLFPGLFVPWDDNIKSGYHRLHKDYGRAYENDDICYFRFLEICQQVVRVLASKTDGAGLTESHPAFRSLGQRRTLPKMLDECNYMEFTFDKQ
jgi:hypothetical protein